MQSKIFIRCPWSKIPDNENFITAEQIKRVFSVIVKTYTYKLKYEKLVAQGKHSEAEAYNLNNIGVFNSFVNEVSSKIVDTKARDYVMECIRTIKNCNFKKSCTKETFDTLYALICKEELRYSMFCEFVSKENCRFIDFLYIFKNCGKVSYNFNSKEISDIENEFTAYKNKVLNNIKV